MWKYILFFHVSDKGWERRGGNGKGVVVKFSFGNVCQNIIVPDYERLTSAISIIDFKKKLFHNSLL